MKRTITATASSLDEAVDIESTSSKCLSIIVPCENCGMWRLVDREADKVGETMGEACGINFHDGLAHYICTCGQPFDLFIDR